MPLVGGTFGVGSGAGVCALALTSVTKEQTRTIVNRLMFFDQFFDRRIDLKPFQQGTFGPGAIVKMRVAEETPALKNCGVMVRIASKIQPSLC